MDHLVNSGAFPDLYSGRKNLELWNTAETFQKKWKKIQKMMIDTFKAKKDATKRERFNKVLEFKEWLLENYHSLPFDKGYLDEIMQEIEEFTNSLTF